MNRDVLSELRDARTIINDGCNERGTLLSGERCKACVRYIDHAILLLKEQEAVKPKKIKGFNQPCYVHYDYVCENCNTDLIYKQPFCAGCGRSVKWE